MLYLLNFYNYLLNFIVGLFYFNILNFEIIMSDIDIFYFFFTKILTQNFYKKKNFEIYKNFAIFGKIFKIYKNFAIFIKNLVFAILGQTEITIWNGGVCIFDLFKSVKIAKRGFFLTNLYKENFFSLFLKLIYYNNSMEHKMGYDSYHIPSYTDLRSVCWSILMFYSDKRGRVKKIRQCVLTHCLIPSRNFSFTRANFCWCSCFSSLYNLFCV